MFWYIVNYVPVIENKPDNKLHVVSPSLMYIHTRTHFTQGSDPSTYEMIQKIQTLQKRLIGKTEEVVEKELLIQEKEKLYVELKHILARQPGPEVAEQLQIYQQTLKEKTKQMKVCLFHLHQSVIYVIVVWI